MLAAALGRRDLAVEWLERAYVERAHSVPYLKVEPLFASLRSDPAIEALIARVGA
jgi:glyoxylate carboligase